MDERSARHSRIASLGYDYAAMPKEARSACNLCGSSRFIVVSHHDRYGFPAEAHGCEICGLVFLNPVMTAGAYAEFYQRMYRPLVSAYHGRLINAVTIQEEQRQYATDLAHLLEPFAGGRSLSTLLDVGGSTGVVAHAIAQRFGLTSAIIDPAADELAEARALGLETITGFIEAHEFGERRFDVVLLCQTIDHLRDMSGTLRTVRRVLPPEGIFFVDIVDFRAAYLRRWSIEDAIKIDHPYYFTDAVARTALARAGFDVVRASHAADHLHIGYVCAPAAQQPAAIPAPASVEGLWHEMRFVQNAPRP